MDSTIFFLLSPDSSQMEHQIIVGNTAVLASHALRVCSVIKPTEIDREIETNTHRERRGGGGREVERILIEKQRKKRIQAVEKVHNRNYITFYSFDWFIYTEIIIFVL